MTSPCSGTSGTSGADAHFRAGELLGIPSEMNADQDGDLRDADPARRITQYTGREDAYPFGSRYDWTLAKKDICRASWCYESVNTVER